MSNKTQALQILDAVVSRVKLITKANGYCTDAGKEIFKGRVQLFEQDELPAITILEGDEQVLDRSYEKTKLRYELSITGAAKATPKNPLDSAHELLGDLKKALFPTDALKDTGFDRLNGLVTKFEYNGRSMAAREDGSKTSYCTVFIAVEYVETPGTP